ncbi:MAG: hypothetical protein ACP5R5_12780 [Armatimonadota bacterium]
MKWKPGFAVILVLLTAAAVRCGAAETAGAARGLIPPPAISVPYGGKVVTEINFSDKDLLGVIKQIIPAIGEVIGTVLPMAAGAAKGPVSEKAVAFLSRIDFKGLADAISGITNFRMLVVKYRATIKPPELTAQLDSGVAKLGQFSRVLSDVSRAPGVLALYAQADGGGYVGYAFDPTARSLYAFRIIGNADYGKLTKWITDAAMLAVDAATSAPAPEPEKAKTEPSSNAESTFGPAPEK